ncbi:monosaccharide transporter [Kwoniella heveanensis BCC8398]|uniref:Monosaccharide transporter n=1 Tax=Kwoniella heveanensis BCC8398 TaxID=1296120 RepID=A0A1B9GM58_9TREE|nr:monosaccharide transporter [Kwoniella heveanensis BCC8398]
MTELIEQKAKSRHPPDRDSIPTLESFGLQLHPDTAMYAEDSQALANSLGGNGLKDVFANWIVVAAAFSACMGGLLFGFDQGILSIVLTMPQFLSQFPDIDGTVTSGAAFNKGVMTGLLELGAFLGALQAGYLADRYSRKKAIGIGAIWFIVGSVIQASSFSYAQLVAGRFIGGVGIGLLSSVAPMYISEIAPPNVRGAFLAMEGATIVIGIVIMFYITYGTRHMAGDWSFRLPFTVQMLPCILLGLGLWRLPYSPRWLAQVGKDRECLDALCRLRMLPPSDPRVQAEWITVRAEAIRNREVVVMSHPSLIGEGLASEIKLEAATWMDMFRPGILQRTLIGVFLMLFQQFQGINALIYYSPTLFEQLGLDYEMQITMSGVLNVCQMVATTSAFFYLDRVGRRPPLLLGSVVNTISHVVVAVMIAKFSGNWDAHPGPAWVGVSFILIFMFSFGLGWSPVPWAMPAEVHASSRRAKGVAITTCCNWLFNFIIGLITPPMIAGITYGTFLFFAAFSFLSALWTWFLCPETKGKTLEEMDVIFHNHAAHEELQAKAEILRAVLGGSLDTPSRGEGVDDEKLRDVYVEHV